MFDKRVALSSGYKLAIENKNVIFYIDNEVGRGASCIVYDGHYYDSMNLRHSVRLKEFYPYNLKIERTEDGRLVSECEANFELGKSEFITAYKNGVELRQMATLTNISVDVYDCYELNNTLYSVISYTEGCVFSHLHDNSVWSLFRRIQTIASIIGKYHELGYLYLDIKPENILMIPETYEYILLFDFDSIVKISNVTNSSQRISFSNGFAAPELVQSDRKHICKQTDIYSIGAMSFYKIFGRFPNAFDSSVTAKYEFNEMSISNEGCQPIAFRLISRFFHKTLSTAICCRYKCVEEMLEDISNIIKFSDVSSQYIFPSHFYSNASFCGRTTEIKYLSDCLEKINQNVVFVSGLGGIGKTELVKKYAYESQKKYAKIVFLNYHESLVKTICDDLSINGIEREEKEEDEVFFNRKIELLKRDIYEINASHEDVLFIVDGFDVDYDNDLDVLLKSGGKYIVVTRNDFSDFGYSQINIGQLQKSEQLDLFNTFNNIDYPSDEKVAIKELLDFVEGHTMMIALIAKYLKNTSEMPHELLEKFQGNAGVLGTNQQILIKQKKDNLHSLKNVNEYLSTLFDLSHFTEIEYDILSGLSFLGQVIVSKDFLHRLYSTVDITSELNSLIRKGWITADPTDKVSLHQIILDLVYTNKNVSIDGCPLFANGMLSYIKDNAYYNQTQLAQKRRLIDNYVSRVRGNNRCFIETLVAAKSRMDEAEKACVILGKEGTNCNFFLSEIYAYNCKSVAETEDYSELEWRLERKELQRQAKIYFKNKTQDILLFMRQSYAYLISSDVGNLAVLEGLISRAFLLNSIASDWESQVSGWISKKPVNILAYIDRLLKYAVYLFNRADKYIDMPEIDDDKKVDALLKMIDFFGNYSDIDTIQMFSNINLICRQEIRFTDYKRAYRYQKQINSIYSKRDSNANSVQNAIPCRYIPHGERLIYKLSKKAVILIETYKKYHPRENAIEDIDYYEIAFRESQNKDITEQVRCWSYAADNSARYSKDFDMWKKCYAKLWELFLPNRWKGEPFRYEQYERYAMREIIELRDFNKDNEFENSVKNFLDLTIEYMSKSSLKNPRVPYSDFLLIADNYLYFWDDKNKAYYYCLVAMILGGGGTINKANILDSVICTINREDLSPEEVDAILYAYDEMMKKKVIDNGEIEKEMNLFIQTHKNNIIQFK